MKTSTINVMCRGELKMTIQAVDSSLEMVILRPSQARAKVVEGRNVN